MGNLIAHLATKQAHRSGILDIRRGFSLMRSREVSASLKIGSLLVGIVTTAILAAFELPIEGFVAVLLPFLGTVIDVAVDGAEFILLPLLLAAGLLPHLVDRKARSIR